MRLSISWKKEYISFKLFTAWLHVVCLREHVFVKYATFILVWIIFLLRLSKSDLNWNDIFPISMYEIQWSECNLRPMVYQFEKVSFISGLLVIDCRQY